MGFFEKYKLKSTEVNKKEAYNFALKIDQARKTSIFDLDQVPLTPQSLLDRANYIHEYSSPLDNKKVLFVGDNDHTSILLGYLSQSLHGTIIDIDTKVLNSINDFIVDEKFDLKTVHQDILQILNKQQKDPIGEMLFDICVTDPPYTKKGFEMFLQYSLLHLTNNGVIYIAAPYMASEDWCRNLLTHIELFLLQHHLVIEEVRQGFGIYTHFEGIISSLIVARKFEFYKMINKNLYTSNKDIRETLLQQS